MYDSGIIPSIGKKCAVNAGYIDELILLKPETIIEIYDPIRYPNEYVENQVARIEIQEDADVFATKILFAPKTCIFSETESRSAAGILYNRTIDFELAKIQQESLNFLFQNKHQKWVAIFVDRNGLKYISGTKDNAMRLSSSKSIAGKNTILSTLTCSSTNPIFSIGGDYLESLVLHEFDFGYNYDYTS